MWILIIIGGILIIVGAVLIWSGRRTQWYVNLMKQAVPTRASEVDDAFPGMLVSIHGVARSERPLVSEHGKTPCLYYSATVERIYEVTEYTAATRDKPSERRTRRSTDTVSSNTLSREFTVEDETGRAWVHPDGAEFDARETVNRFEPATGGGGSSISIGPFDMNLGNNNQTIGYRYTESIIPIDEPVYVLGVVAESGAIARPGKDQKNATLVISHRTENALREAWGSSAQWQAYGALGSIAVGVALVVIAAVVAIL